MKRHSTWVAAVGVTALAVPLLRPVASATAAPPPDQHVIVELTGAPAFAAGSGALHPAAVAARTTQLRTQHNHFRDALRSAGIHVRTQADVTGVINAVAVAVPAAAVGRLRTLPGVAAVYPDETVHADADADVAITNAPQVWATRDPDGRPDTGDGQVVAVLDTGIDYTHPDLGAGFGPGHKVVGGYDFVNNDGDPMDDNGHGTHVAGLIAGDADQPDGRTGEAPGASLTAYKVLDGDGNGYESQILEGLDAAVDPTNPYRADVVNMSLSGDPAVNDPLEQASEDAIASGVVVVAAAGNNGPGESTVGSPAEAPHVLAVGASVTGVDVPSLTVTAPVLRRLDAARLDLSANPPAGGERLSVVDVGQGQQESDYDGKDVAGKAVLFDYNETGLAQRLVLAQEHHAAAAIIATANYYSGGDGGGGPVVPGLTAGTTDPDRLNLVATVINGADGADLRQWLADGPVRISIGAADATDQIASFSARGPALGSYAVKPDLVAPGVDLSSTWPGGGYRDDSGTSMAAPHVAGAAALVRQAHPDWTAGQVAAALTAGAHPLPGADANLAGTGRLDVAAADALAVLPSPRSLDLGLADLSAAHVVSSGVVTFTNVGTRTARVTFAARRDDGAALAVHVSPATARVAPGHAVRVTVRLTGSAPASGADETGMLLAKSGGVATSVPYSLAVRPLDLHATPDPTTSTSTVLIHSAADLQDAPTVTVTPPHGRSVTGAATWDHDNWYRFAIPSGPVGTYHVTAAAPARLGATLTGSTLVERLTDSAGSGDWQSVGPDTTGAAVMAPTSRPGRMYVVPAVQQHGSVLRTDDSGATWHEMRNFPVSDGVTTGVVSPTGDPDTAYLSINGDDSDPSYHGKILVTHDAGATWTSLSFPDVGVRSMTIDSTGTTLAVAGWDKRVWVSSDAGGTWSSFASPDGTPAHTLVVGPDLYVACEDGVWVVRGYASGLSAPQQVLASSDYQDVFDNLAVSGSTIYAQSATSVYVSHDDGARWSPSYSTTNPNDFLVSLQVVHGDVYAGAKAGALVQAGGTGTWTRLPLPTRNRDTLLVGSFQPSGDQIVMSAAHSGLFTTSDAGATYRRVGLTAATVSALTVDQATSGAAQLLAGTPNNALHTPIPELATPTGATRDWGLTGHETAIGFNVASLATDPSDPSVVYAATVNANSRVDIERSEDGGTTWAGVLSVRTGSHAFQIVVDPADPDYVYVTVIDPLSPGVIVTRDGGQTWRKDDLPASVTAVAADPTSPEHIWLGGPDGLFQSFDAGRTITRLSSTPVSALAVDPRNPKHLLVGGNGVWESTNGGRTTTASYTSPFRLHISSFAFAADGTVVAGDSATTDGAGLPVGGRGVLVRRAHHTGWINASAGLPDLSVTSVALSPDGKWLFAGTDCAGVYRRPAR